VEKKMNKETEEKRAERQSLYESYKMSGETMTSYAKRVGMSYWKFQYAMEKSRREEAGEASDTSASSAVSKR
jgi:hypothetical protein